jgi:hypothetical protein
MMTFPVLLSAIVGGSVSFLVAVLFNTYRDRRNRKRAASESDAIWE